MFKKLKVVGIVLSVVCLYSLCTARGVEAVPNPDKILSRLEVRLDKIVSVKINKFNTKMIKKISKLTSRVNAGKISLAEFSKKLQKLEGKADRRRGKFDRKIAKVTRKKMRRLQRIGADVSDINEAQDLENKAHTDNLALHNELKNAIDNARDILSPSS